MLMPDAPSFAAKPAPQTMVGAFCPAPLLSKQVAPAGNCAAQLPVAVIAQLASLVVPTRLHVAVVGVPSPMHFAVHVEPTVMAQLVSQLALATLVNGTPVQRIGVQVPDGSDQEPLMVSHKAEGLPVEAPVQVAVHCVWFVQPAVGHAAPSGVVAGTPVQVFVGCCVTGQAVPGAVVYTPSVEQVADTVPPIEQEVTQTKPGSWLRH